MESVAHEEGGVRLPRIIQHRCPNIDVTQLCVGGTIGGNQLIRLDHLVGDFPSLQAGLDRDKVNLRLGQMPVHVPHKVLKIGQDPLGRFARGDIIVPRINEYFPRRIRGDDPVGEVMTVDDLRSTEATIDHMGVREIRFESLPESNTGTTNEQCASLGDGACCVRFFERLDGLFPFGIAGQGNFRESDDSAQAHENSQADEGGTKVDKLDHQWV